MSAYTITTPVTVLLTTMLKLQTCLICTNPKAHLERARKARSEYSKDDSSGSKIYTADMQKIILLQN